MSALLRHAAAIAPVVWLVAAVGPAQELSRRAGAINDVANVLSSETEASLNALVEYVGQGTAVETGAVRLSLLRRWSSWSFSWLGRRRCSSAT